MIALQRKIDGQSIANGDDVPWYGVGTRRADAGARTRARTSSIRVKWT